MNGSSVYFLVLSGLVALLGLLAGGFAEGYLSFFGFALTAFGVLFGFNTLKRHFDEQDAARR